MTISLDEDVYDGLYRTVGKRQISQFVSDILRPHVSGGALEAGYRAMAADDDRERGAADWIAELAGDGGDAPR